MGLHRYRMKVLELEKKIKGLENPLIYEETKKKYLKVVES